MMGILIISLIEENVSSVEIKEWIFRIPLDSIIIILLGLFKFTNMIKSKTSIVIMEGVRFNLNCF